METRSAIAAVQVVGDRENIDINYRELWCAVIRQAVTDLAIGSEREEAARWLGVMGEKRAGYIAVCEFAGVDHNYLTTRARKAYLQRTLKKSNRLQRPAPAGQYWGSPCRINADHVEDGHTLRYETGHGCLSCMRRRCLIRASRAKKRI